MGTKVVKQFIRSNAAYLKNIRLESGNGGVCDVAGIPPIFLYSGECYNILLKTINAIDTINVIGSDGTKDVKLSVRATDTNGNAELLGKVWAKKKISEYEFDALDINPRHDKLIRAKIIETSMKHGIICRYTNYIAVNEREEKLENLPKVVAVPVKKPKRALYSSGSGILSQSELDGLLCCISSDSSPPVTTPKRSRRPSGSGILSQCELDSLLCNIDSSAYDYSSDSSDNESTLIDALFDYIKGQKQPVSETVFTSSVKAKIIELANECDNIDFADNFEKIDEILSLVEFFAGKGDKEFDDSFGKLIQRLEENCRIADKQTSLIDIAGMQNFDGSFCHCRCLKATYSVIALKRFLNEGDAYIYRKQIEKLFAYLRDAGVTGQSGVKLSECVELAKKLGISV